MMKKAQQIVKSFVLVAIVLLGLSAPLAAAPVDVLDRSCEQSADSPLCEGRNEDLFGPNSIWSKIINAFIFVIGAVAVIMIIVGGFRYVLSGGDSGSVNSAKNTILYAVIGLVIAIMSYAIVNFVLASL